MARKQAEVWCKVCGLRKLCPIKEAIEIGVAHKNGNHKIGQKR